MASFCVHTPSIDNRYLGTNHYIFLKIKIEKAVSFCIVWKMENVIHTQSNAWCLIFIFDVLENYFTLRPQVYYNAPRGFCILSLGIDMGRQLLGIKLGIRK